MFLVFTEDRGYLEMGRAKRGRYTRPSASRWGELLAEQAQSGLSQRRFCERHDLSYSSFGHWKRRLGADVGMAEREQEFVELTVQRPPEDTAWEVELTLDAGVVLRVRRR
jgi:hypothetical protein